MREYSGLGLSALAPPGTAYVTQSSPTDSSAGAAPEPRAVRETSGSPRRANARVRAPVVAFRSTQVRWVADAVMSEVVSGAGRSSTTVAVAVSTRATCVPDTPPTVPV